MDPTQKQFSLNRAASKSKFLSVQLLTGMLMLPSCATTTSQVAFHEESPPNKDEVLIYVYRLPSVVGAAVKWPVRLDNKVVAVLRPNAYAVVRTSPGPHLVTLGDPMIGIPGAILDSYARKGGTLKAEAGGVYFVRSAGFTVSLAPREKALSELANVKYDP